MSQHRDHDVDAQQSTPRWVKVFGAVILVVLLAFALLLLFGGGKHGPGRHMRGGRAQNRVPAESAPA